MRCLMLVCADGRRGAVDLIATQTEPEVNDLVACVLRARRARARVAARGRG